MALQKLICAELRVDDLAEAVAFNVDVFGLTEVGDEDGRVFLTCGGDDGATQLVLRAGDSGVESFTLGVDSEEDLEHYATRLRAIGIESETRTDAAPRQGQALTFSLPGGLRVELVPAPDRAVYPHPAFD